MPGRVPRATAGRPALAPVLWAAAAVAAAVTASLLAGSGVGSAVPTVVGTAVTRSGMNLAGTAGVGLGLVGLLLPVSRAALAVQARADRLLVVVGSGWLAVILVGVLFRAADAVDRPVAELSAGELGLWATRLAAGRGMLLTALCAAAVLVCAAVRVHRPDRVAVRIPLVAALLGVLTPAVTGHAGSAPNHQIAVITAALHVGAAALWVGGLGALLVLVARDRTVLMQALPGYSRLAGVCVAGVAVTGVLSAQVRLPDWQALFGTGYGGLVLAKAVLLVGIGALGLLARRRLAADRTPVLRWAGYEVALMATAIGIAAALTQTA